MSRNSAFISSIVRCRLARTASGKTTVAVELVKQFPFDIISVDSVLVYRGMDIGTAKPDADVLAVAPHRLIDIRDPSEPYSAAEFCEDALDAMANITAQGRIPLLAGGTFLYFRALEQGLSAMPPADPEIRVRLEAEARQNGWQALHVRLADIDPEAAARIHETDQQRIQRALEVYEISGLPISLFHTRGRSGALPYRLLKLALSPEDRVLLHERIENRFKSMLDAGFVEEVRGLYERGDLSPELPAMRAVGYRQVWAYLAGKSGFDEMVEQAIVATRQYAKRQLTWLRSENDLVSHAAETPYPDSQIAECLTHWLQQSPQDV